MIQAGRSDSCSTSRIASASGNWIALPTKSPGSSGRRQFGGVGGREKIADAYWVTLPISEACSSPRCRWLG